MIFLISIIYSSVKLDLFSLPTLLDTLEAFKSADFLS